MKLEEKHKEFAVKDITPQNVEALTDSQKALTDQLKEVTQQLTERTGTPSRKDNV